MGSSYDSWADVYDSVYSYVRDDIPFYVAEAAESDGPVLELGCGTGRVTIPIAEAGIDVTGLDSSEAMLEVALRKAQDRPAGERPTLLHSDMRDFSLDRRFGLVIIPFRGFLSLLTVEDQLRTLRNVRRHLAPGGRLVFNVFVPDLDTLVEESDSAQHLRDVTDPESGRVSVLWHRSTYDNHNQIIDTTVIVDRLDEGGTVVERFYRDFQLRYAHRWEIHHLLEVCGFQVRELYGDFDRTDFDEESIEMVWVAGAAE
jgi:SAM-dependent methyltransferase